MSLKLITVENKVSEYLDNTRDDKCGKMIMDIVSPKTAIENDKPLGDMMSSIYDMIGSAVFYTASSDIDYPSLSLISVSDVTGKLSIPALRISLLTTKSYCRENDILTLVLDVTYMKPIDVENIVCVMKELFSDITVTLAICDTKHTDIKPRKNKDKKNKKNKKKK